MNKVGLSQGKFAPFHKGHQLVIERAINEMDKVIVMIYDCPETISVPVPVRSHWIRELYPSVEVIEAWDCPIEVGDTQEIKQKHEVYILEKLNGRKISHFYSSEFYGEHVSAALGAVNCLVDCKRETVPISGTMIRQASYRYKAFIHPSVYRV